MGRSRFLAVLMVSSLLSLSFTHGFRRVLSETVEHHQHSTAIPQEISGESRVTIEVMDYGGPVANTNPKYGDLESPPMPPTVSPHLL